MTRDEIRRGIQNLGPWWHCIDSSDGIRTKTTSLMGEEIDHPRGRWAEVGRQLPADLTGQSVLDIGCNAGFFSIEAKRRGANRVLGIEAQRLEFLQANFVKNVLGIDIDYQQRSIYDLDPASDGTFDVTLALGLIYHCKHILRALDILHEMTDDLLIVDSSVVPEIDANRPAFQAGGLTEVIHTVGYVQQSAEPRCEVGANWFLPTPSALRAMLLDAGFATAEIVLAEGTRAVVVCRKGDATIDSSTGRGLDARLAIVESPTSFAAGAEAKFVVDVSNTGRATWLATRGSPRKGEVWLGSHLIGGAGDIVWDYARAYLTADVHPGETARLDLRVRLPERPGEYVIEFDPVCEQIAWFQDIGSRPLRFAVAVS